MSEDKTFSKHKAGSNNNYSGFKKDGGFPKRGTGFKREGGFKRDGGFTRGGGHSKDGGAGSGFKREGGFKRDGGFTRGGGHSKDGGAGSGFKREGGFKRDGGFTRGGGHSKDGGAGSGFKREGGFKRDGGFTRGGGHSKDGGAGSGFKREGGFKRDGGFTRGGGHSKGGGAGSGFKREGGFKRDGGFTRGGGHSKGGGAGSGFKREGGFKRDGGFTRGGGHSKGGGAGSGFKREGGFKRDGGFTRGGGHSKGGGAGSGFKREGGFKRDSGFKRDAQDQERSYSSKPNISGHKFFREVAISLIGQIYTKVDFIDNLITSDRGFRLLEGSNRAMARNIISNSLRHKSLLDFIIRKYVTVDDLDEKLRFILYAALTEELILNTPAYAVLHSYVDITKKLYPAGSGLVNAVLRRVEENMDEINAIDFVQLKQPWFYYRWQKEYSEAQAKIFIQALASQPTMDLTFRSPEKLQIAQTEIEGAVVNNEYSLRVPTNINLSNVTGYAQGDFWVQSLSSFLSVYSFKDKLKGKYVLDVCAAPGGKTLTMNALGAKKICAFDKADHRISVIKKNLERMKISSKEVYTKSINVFDIEDFETFDVILLDAPCISTGTLRKNPEIVVTKKPVMLKATTDIQLKMLRYIFSRMKVGTTLIYATCSLQKEENEHLINNFMIEKKPSGARIVPIEANENITSDMITKEGYMRITPDMYSEHGGLEGFFAAHITKVEK